MKQAATLTILTGMLVGGSILALRLANMPKVQAQVSCTSANFQGAYGPRGTLQIVWRKYSGEHNGDT
jgi:hypothetical protein